MRTTVIRRFLPAALLAIHAGLLAYGAGFTAPSSTRWDTWRLG